MLIQLADGKTIELGKAGGTMWTLTEPCTPCGEMVGGSASTGRTNGEWKLPGGAGYQVAPDRTGGPGRA
mgnify:CR=1 FL=1